MHTGPRIFHICEQHCLARRAGITWAGKFHQDYFNGNPLLLLLRRRRLYVPCPTRHRHTGQFPLPVHSGQKSSKNMSYLIISYPLLVSFIRCCLWVQIQIVPTYVDIHFEHCKKNQQVNLLLYFFGAKIQYPHIVKIEFLDKNWIVLYVFLASVYCVLLSSSYLCIPCENQTLITGLCFLLLQYKIFKSDEMISLTSEQKKLKFGGDLPWSSFLHTSHISL